MKMKMKTKTFWRALCAGTLISCLAAGAFRADATAHEEGVLTLASATVAAGSSVNLGGDGFSPSTSYRLVLRGAMRTYELASVESDADGAFSVQLEIPADVRPGSYRLVTVAPDGDDTASADLEVGPAPLEVDDRTDAETGEFMHDASTMPAPSAEEMAIERRWSGAEWFVIGLLLGGAAVGGTVLYRRPKMADSA